MKPIPPIFLYTGWRTGGTALSAAFKSVTSTLLFFDPLSPILENPDSARDANSRSWASNHPAGLSYFEPFLFLYEDGKIPGFPDLSNFVFRNSSEIFQNDLVLYIKKLVRIAEDRGLTAVFKLEQLEGHVSLLRSNFPGSSHIGVVREFEPQYQSWLEQKALGNPSFFESAKRLIHKDPDFFEPHIHPSELNPMETFQTYYKAISKLREDFDHVLDLSRESFNRLLTKYNNKDHHDIFVSAFSEYEKVESAPSVEFKFYRMQEKVLSLIEERDGLTQERDGLTQERDGLTQERDALTQERDALTQERESLSKQFNEVMNSTIWRATKPIRWFVNLVKR